MSVAALAAGSADKSESRISRAPYRMEAPKAGRALKQIRHTAAFNNVVNPMMRPDMRKAANQGISETPLAESFENGGQLPTGWSVKSKGSAELDDMARWFVNPQLSPYMPGPSDGEYYAGIGYPLKSDLEQDEWLISPEFELGAAKYELTFMGYISRAHFFVIDDEHVDVDNMKWKKQEIKNTLQILVQPEGGEWEVLRDMAEEAMGTEYKDLAMEIGMSMAMSPYSTDMSKYAGKKIRIALRLLGYDGNFIFIDDVKVTLPSPEAIIAPDYHTMYYGFSDDPGWKSLVQRIAVYPAYRPIRFTNMSYDDVIYSWLYQDPATGEMVADADPESIEVTYGHDIDPATGTAASFVNPPVLVAEGEGYKTVQNPWGDADMIQIGGAPRIKLYNGLTKTYGLLPFEEKTYDIGYYSVDCDPIGKMAVPAFGYNSDTDEYWTYYTTQGESMPGDYCHLTAYYNMIYPGESPLVIDGVNALAWALVGDNAEFKCEIYPYVDYYEDGELLGQVRGDKPIATATCKGSDILNRDPTIQTALILPFTFDKKVVLDDSHAAYCAMISGFRSDEVQFFAPVQQWQPDPNYLCFGWVEKEMNIYGRQGTAQHALGYYANEFGDMYCAFAICLTGYYPWLESEKDSVDLGDANTAEISLDSYNDASALTIESSPWIKASATGRYRDTKLVITTVPGTEDEEGFVTVAADGMSKTIKVTRRQSGIDDAVAGTDAEIEAVYTIDGVRVNAEALPAGVYIEVYTDGTARKRVVK